MYKKKSNKLSVSVLSFILLIGCLLAIGLVVFMVMYADTIVKYHLEEKVFFPMLVILAAVISVLFFGILQSTAGFEGKVWGGTLRISGAACLFIVILVLGMKMSETRPSAPTHDAVIRATVTGDTTLRR